MRTLKFVIAALIALVILVICVANHQMVQVKLWPDLTGYGLPDAPSQALPFFVFPVITGFVGFAFGLLFEWFREFGVRKTARRATREAEALKAKVEELTRDADDDLPALPSR